LNLRPEIIEKIIEQYTSESGVRNIEKQIASITRNIAKSVATDEKYDPTISMEQVHKILGAPRFLRDRYQTNDVAGVVTGLAWTSVGGQILFIETSLSKGKGKLTLTGNLGEVMKESALLALAYLKAHNEHFGITSEAFDNWDIHIHVPEGATPKDGPSAGVTMLTSLASAFTQRKVKNNLAMTGEITLRGKVRKDIEDINEVYLKNLKFHYIKTMTDVIDIALMNEKVANALVINSKAEPKKKGVEV